MDNKLSIRQKTWMLITFVLVVSVIGIGLFTHYLYENFYIHKQIDLLTARGHLLSDLYFDDQDESKQEFLNRVKWMNKCAEANVFFTEDVDSLLGAGQSEALITPMESEALKDGEVVNVIRRQPFVEKPLIGVAVPVVDNHSHLKGIIFLYNPLLEIVEPFYETRVSISIGIIIMVTFIVYAVKAIINKITLPLENMRVISEKMAAGDFSKRIEVKSNDEIGSLAHSFNSLSMKLEHADAKKREFLSNVSHELRTPLSYIKGYTEAILDNVVAEPTKYIKTINEEADRMHRLVHDLLDLAQLEDDSYPMRVEPIPFAQLIEDVVERFELAAHQKNVIITKNLDDEAIVFGDSDRLEQVIRNILENGLRYTPKGKKIEIMLKRHESESIFTISDQGQGISESILPKITDRFYRIDKSRSRKEGGTGLGLAIVAEILKKHHATLTFNSKENEGTTVKISFPKSLTEIN